MMVMPTMFAARETPPSFSRWLALLLACALLGPACAPKAPPIVPGPPAYPEYLYPAVPADLARTAQAPAHQAAWARLQSGDARRAAREFDDIVKRAPAFHPAMAGQGYAALAVGDHRLALAAFDRSLKRDAKYVPALVGRGEALLGLEQEDEALEAFTAALTLDAGLQDVRRRIEVLKFRGLEDRLAAARAARRAGRLDEARAKYTAALEVSPDSGLVYRELAEVERKAGDYPLALEHVRQALQLDPGDGAAALLEAEVLEARGELEAAVEAYRRAEALDAAPDLGERIEAIRRKMAYGQLPQQYRDLPAAPRVTRGDVAALVGIRLEPVVAFAPPRYAGLVTDARGHWAATWITALARAGIMEPLPNHTFQPRAALRRGELAQVVSRLLAVIGRRDPQLAQAWTGRRQSFSDLGPGHVMYGPASTAVSAGVMNKADGEAFGASRVVTGAEAVAAVERLERLAERAGFPRVKGAALP